MKPGYEECERCGYTAPSHDRYRQKIMLEYDGEMLCSACRVDARLEDNDFSNND